MNKPEGFNEAWIEDTKDAVLGAFKSIAAHTSTADSSIYAAAVTLEIFVFVLQSMCEKQGLKFDKLKVEKMIEQGRGDFGQYVSLLRDEITGIKIGSKARVKMEVGPKGEFKIKVKE